MGEHKCKDSIMYFVGNKSQNNWLVIDISFKREQFNEFSQENSWIEFKAKSIPVFKPLIFFILWQKKTFLSAQRGKVHAKRSMKKFLPE